LSRKCCACSRGWTFVDDDEDNDDENGDNSGNVDDDDVDDDAVCADEGREVVVRGDDTKSRPTNPLTN
jgi:hypothetical protein